MLVDPTLDNMMITHKSPSLGSAVDQRDCAGAGQADQEGAGHNHLEMEFYKHIKNTSKCVELITEDKNTSLFLHVV